MYPLYMLYINCYREKKTTVIALVLPGKIQVLVSRAGEEGERSKGKTMDGRYEVHLAEVAPADVSLRCGGESVGHLINVITVIVA